MDVCMFALELGPQSWQHCLRPKAGNRRLREELFRYHILFLPMCQLSCRPVVAGLKTQLALADQPSTHV